jgi:hypothetical protein
LNDRNNNQSLTKRDTAAPVPRPSQPVVLSPSGQQLAQIVASNPLLPRIHLAMMFPRDVAEFESRLRNEVLAAPEQMVYAKPQGNEKLRGPSIRMAEVAARHFRNLSVGEPKVEERDNRVTVTIEALDLESNCSTSGTATTSLVGKDRKRMRDDVVSNLVSATVSRAKRNAIQALIGRAVFDRLVKECLELERKKAAGLSPEQKRGEWNKAVQWWAKAKITEADLLRFCRASSPAEVTPEAFVDLRAACVAVQKEGIDPRVALGLDGDDAAVDPPSPAEPNDPPAPINGFFDDDDDNE